MRGIPGSVDAHLPILEIVSDGDPHDIVEVTGLVADRLGVAGKARTLTGSSGRSLFGMNVRRAAYTLRAAGLIENEKIGKFGITKEGKDILAGRPPRRIGTRYLLDHSEKYRLHRKRLDRNTKNLQRAAKAGVPRERRGMVAIIDVLGAKGSWRGGGGGGGGGAPAPGLHKKWHGLLGSTRRLLRDDCLAGKKMTFSAFSDTMFITVEERDYEGLLLAFGRTMWQAITHSIREDVPVRGCVSCGSYFYSPDNLFTGPAVDEASAYYYLPQWIGISAAPSANGVLSKAMPRAPSRGGGAYLRHDIPLKASVEQDAWALNWPGQCDDEGEDGAMDEIIDRINDRMDATTDIDAALKWRNTRKFCNAALPLGHAKAGGA